MRQRVFITAALLAFLAFGISRIAVINGFIEMDEVVHYLQARYAPHHPFLYASIWARPLFVLLYTPACQFPFDVARGFTLLMAAFAGYLAYRESDRKGIPWPALAFALTVAQPLYIKQSYTVMTEHTLALLLIASLHFWETDRRDLSCFLMSLTPLSRPEGFFLGPLWFLLVILDRNAAVRDRLRRSSILLTGLLLWALISRLFCGTPLWFVQNFPWVHHGSAHNATLWDFPARLPQFASLPVIALAMIGLVTIRRYKLQMASLLSFFLIALHSLFWARGYFGSTGYLRYFVPISPFIGMTAAAGFSTLVEFCTGQFVRFMPRLKLQAARLSVIAVLLIALVSLYVAHLRAYPVRMPAPRPEALILLQLHELLQPAINQGRIVYCSDPQFYLLADHDPWDVGLTNRAFLRFIRNDQLKLRDLLASFPKGSLIIFDHFWMETFMGVGQDDLSAIGYAPVVNDHVRTMPDGNVIRLFIKAGAAPVSKSPPVR